MYVANGLNQYASVARTTFSYDGRGNLTGDGSRTFAYDLENHLLSVTGAASMTLSYDPLDRLQQTMVGSTITQFLYDGDRLSAEYDGASTLLRRYVHGPGVDEPLAWYEGSGTSDRRYLIGDHQGSIIAENGAGTTRYSYGPYGEPNSWAGSRFRYTGQIALPEVSLYHYKARVYDPVLGRFLQTDPVGYQDDFNLYAYVRNDPLNRGDPTGTDSASMNMANGICQAGGACDPQSGIHLGSAIEGLSGTLHDLAGAADNLAMAMMGMGPVGAAGGEATEMGSVALEEGAVAVERLAPALSDSDIVVRGGAATRGGGNSIEGIAAGTGTHPSGATGFSAEARPGATLCELCANVPNNQVGVTTVGEIRAAGGNVVATSGRSPNHVTVTGVSPETANRQLTPTQSNPVPPEQRRF